MVHVITNKRVVCLRPRHLRDGGLAGGSHRAVSVVDVDSHVADARRRHDALHGQSRRALPRGRNCPRQGVVALEVAPVTRLVARLIP